MNLLTPLFLLGALAVALPVIFHLIRRTTREKTVFSSLMFLLPSPPRLTRRSRLEHLLLLALRCLALCLLALGFSRPFLQKAVSDERSSTAAKRTVILVDTSASMKRANLWSDARDRADSVLRKAAPEDQVAVYTFDRQTHPLVTFDQWKAVVPGERAALASRRLADTSPGWSGTRLDSALLIAAEALADLENKSATGPREIVLITDLQEGSRLEQLQRYEWPKGIDLSIESLKARNPNNAGIQLVTDLDDSAQKTGATARVRVTNAADSKREQFKVGWALSDDRHFAGPPIELYVPAGQSRIIPVPAPPSGQPLNRIILQGDDEEFDNIVFAIPPETARLSVLYFGSDTEPDSKQPLYFLQRAFQETRRQTVQVLARAETTPLPATEGEAAALLVVTDSLSEPRADALHNLVASGKTLLFALKNDAVAPTLARLCGVNALTLEEVRPENNYAMLAEIDFRHPLFAAFADPRFSDFTKIHFWKYRRINASALPGARAVAKFDNGDPALLEVPVGKGRVLVLATGWQPEDSQLALSTKFVPMLYSTLDYSGAAAPPAEQYSVGDTLPLTYASDATPATIQLPDGSKVNLTPGQTNFSQTLAPGIYALTSATRTGGFAVNLDARESRTAPLPTDELERLGAPVVTQLSTAAARQSRHQVRLQNSELENRQKLWRWFLVGTAAVLLFETWLAGRTARRRWEPTAETAVRA